MNKLETKELLTNLSESHGFLACGVSTARRLVEEENRLQQWLKNGYQGEMQYMENHFDKRLDPTLLLPGAKSIITFLYNYYPVTQQKSNSYKVAKYAYGEDYHRVIKDKLYVLIDKLQESTGKLNYRIFVDSAPVMERQWAALSGLGWIGKNSLLLRQGVGSFFFIATILCDLELDPDQPTTDHCGNCTACIDACPTQAIVGNQLVDARRCISYQTIELKEPIPIEFQSKTEDWILGCDICQDVCPWNRFSKENNEPRFQPNGDWLEWDKEQWQNMDSQEFEVSFAISAVLRAGFEKLKDNIQFQA